MAYHTKLQSMTIDIRTYRTNRKIICSYTKRKYEIILEFGSWARGGVIYYWGIFLDKYAGDYETAVICIFFALKCPFYFAFKYNKKYFFFMK